MISKKAFLFLPFVIVLTLACSLFTRPAQSTDVVVDSATDESPVPDSFTLVTLHRSQGELSSLLAYHASQAAQLNRRPFAEFSAEWCPPCKAIANSLADPQMVEAFHDTYIIRIDIDEWKSQIAKSDFNFLGVPTFFELNGDGQPSGRVITGAAWGEDIPENMAPPLKEFFQVPAQE